MELIRGRKTPLKNAIVISDDMKVKLKPCPFCGSTDIYETHSEEDTLGTKNPEIFCNSCKIIFSIEDDSPYTDCDEDYAYRKAKTMEAWNKRVREVE